MTDKQTETVFDVPERMKQYGFAYAVDWLSSDERKALVIDALLVPHARDALGYGKVIEIRAKLGPFATPDFGRNPKFQQDEGMLMETYQWGMAWFHTADMQDQPLFGFVTMDSVLEEPTLGALLMARILL